MEKTCKSFLHCDQNATCSNCDVLREELANEELSKKEMAEERQHEENAFFWEMEHDRSGAW